MFKQTRKRKRTESETTADADVKMIVPTDQTIQWTDTEKTAVKNAISLYLNRHHSITPDRWIVCVHNKHPVHGLRACRSNTTRRGEYSAEHPSMRTALESVKSTSSIAFCCMFTSSSAPNPRAAGPANRDLIAAPGRCAKTLFGGLDHLPSIDILAGCYATIMTLQHDRTNDWLYQYITIDELWRLRDEPFESQYRIICKRFLYIDQELYLAMLRRSRGPLLVLDDFLKSLVRCPAVALRQMFGEMVNDELFANAKTHIGAIADQCDAAVKEYNSHVVAARSQLFSSDIALIPEMDKGVIELIAAYANITIRG